MSWLCCRTAEGYFYYPEGEVGYPVCVPVRVEPASTCCHIEVSSPSASPSAWEQQGDTTEAAECGSGAEKPRGKVERAELREPTLEERRRSSINIYQGQSKPEAIKPSPASSRVSLAVPGTITRHKVSSAKLFGLAWLGLSPRWQSVDEDHPDLQSIQNIVANMTFSAD